MERLKLVIFDMDGLLFDTEWPSYLAMKKAVEGRGLSFPISNYRQLIGLHGSMSRSVLDKLYDGKLEIDSVIEEYRVGFKEILETEGVSLKPGAKKLLNWLEEQEIKKCIASSSSRSTITDYLKRVGFESRFDFFISGSEVENGKPHPDIFIEACRRAGENPTSAIVLEDSLNGLLAAHAANIRCILIPDLIEPTEEMKEKAYLTLPDLEKVIPIIKS